MSISHLIHFKCAEGLESNLSRLTPAHQPTPQAGNQDLQFIRSSLHWTIPDFLYAFFLQWSILATSTSLPFLNNYDIRKGKLWRRKEKALLESNRLQNTKTRRKAFKIILWRLLQLVSNMDLYNAFCEVNDFLKCLNFSEGYPSENLL